MISKDEAKLIKKYVQQHNPILIAKHLHPDWDAEGSAMGLAYLLQKNYPRKQIYVLGDRISHNQDFLPPTDLKSLDHQKTLLITVDTANYSRLDCPTDLNVEAIIKIDHHPEMDIYGTFNIVDENAIACAQMLVQLAQKLHWKWTEGAALNLYRGILTDSGRFLHEKTNHETFSAAAFLSKNYNLQSVHEELYVDVIKKRQWGNFVFQRMQVSPHGVASIILLPQDYETWKLNYEQLKSALGVMAGIEEIKIWILIIEWKGENKVSLRSRHYDVNSVAQNYGGGGHRLAAGAKLDDLKTVPQLIKDLDQLIIKTDKEQRDGAK